MFYLYCRYFIFDNYLRDFNKYNAAHGTDDFLQVVT